MLLHAASLSHVSLLLLREPILLNLNQLLTFHAKLFGDLTLFLFVTHDLDTSLVRQLLSQECGTGVILNECNLPGSFSVLLAKHPLLSELVHPEDRIAVMRQMGCTYRK